VLTGFWCVDPSERVHLEDPGIDGRMILSSIFKKWALGLWTGSIRLRIRTGGGYFVNAIMNLRVP